MLPSDPARFYREGDYERLNPSWDSADSQWKAALVADLLARHQLVPRTLVEVGCGAGGVLGALQALLPDTALEGWEIAPGAARFWPSYAGVRFHTGDILESPTVQHDVLLLIDVVEHVANPHDFLSRLARRAAHMVLHIPLDLSVASVWREKPLLAQRRGVGHIHYFTRNLAVELLRECGYEVLEASFTGAHLRQRDNWHGRAAGMLRRMVFALGRERGVRLLGGDTLLVLARPPNAI